MNDGGREAHARGAKVSTRPVESCLAGGGEMGALMRATDWSRTPLGPVSGWEHSLSVAVSIMLNSRYPMFVWWGSELIYLYNDGHQSILGDRHPHALAQPAHVVWPEIWDAIGPQAHAVLSEGRATWNQETFFVMERKGYREEAFFTFSYSPIPDDAGGIGGVYCAVIEDTQRVLSGRRLKVLGELAARTTENGTSAEQACCTATQVLAGHARDISFALIYLLDEDAHVARLAASTGLVAGSPCAPGSVELRSADADEVCWPLAAVLASRRTEVVTELSSRFAPLPGGAWAEPTSTTLVLPIVKSGQERLAGFLVAGASPLRPLDDEYRVFFDLLASHIATAITNASAHEQERRRAEALAELDRAKTAFFSNVSHEFRTPLTLMLGPLGDILGSAENGVVSEHREWLEVVHRNGLRLQKLVNTLLDFSRIEAGRTEASYEPTDLAVLTAEIASSFRSACERAGVRLIVECPPLSEPVYVDRDMWEKIVLNLVSNAFKFTFEGEIRVSTRLTGDRFELSVRDTGTGIPAQAIPRLFERFYRVQGAAGRTQEGSGIGLAFVRELARQHGGQVGVESTPGRGSVFTVSLPLGHGHLPASRIGAARTLASTALGAAPFVEEALRWLPSGARPTGAVTASIAGPASAPAAKHRILLADDNADMREYLGRLLAERYEVDAVADGEAALSAIRSRLPELVLVDVMMPRMDGFALLQALRADPATRALPVILLSARAGEESRIEGLEAGADDYLVKPFGARELLARVGSVLAMARLRAERDVVETRLRLQFERMPIACIVCDAQNHIVEWNAAAERVFGWRAAEVLGMEAVPLLVPAASRPETHEILNRLTAGDMAAHSVNPNITKDGRIILCEWHNTPLRGADGKVIGILSMAQDITQRRQAEEALRESQANLAAELAGMARLQNVSKRLVPAGDSTSLLQEIMDAAIAITNADMGCIELLDRAGGRLNIVASRGFERAFLEFFAAPDGYDADCGAEAQRGERLVVEDVTTSPIFAGVPSLDAMLVAGVCAFQSTPLVGRSGALVGVLSTHYRTQRRFAERDLRVVDMLARQAADWIERTQAEEALRQSEERFRRTFECNMVAMGMWTRDGGVVAANDALLNMLGYTRAELEAGLLNWLKITPPEYLPLDHRSLAEIDRTGVAPAFEKEFVHKDGHRIPILLGAAAFTGTADRGVFFVIDLSERKRAEEERTALLASEREARSAAERANRMKDDFLATVSHELKTPINGVLMWTHLLKSSELDAATMTEALDAVETGMRAQARLIDDLLDVSRITSGKLHLKAAPVDLAAIVDAAVDAVMPAADLKGIVVRRRFELPRVVLHGDATRLQQVFSNLLTNAVKFTPDWGSVDVSLARIEANVVVSVRDTGKGIDPEFLQHVFERFRQADSSAAREHGGLGLGLSIVKRLVEAHDGTISVQSEGLGRGVTFTVSLPVTASAGESVDASPAQSPDTSLAGVRVLFVDDNPDTRSVVARVLAERGAEIETAGSAEEALALLSRVRPHVLIADIGMPGKDGYELIRDIRRSAEHGRIPGVALTAFARAEDRVRALQAGYDMHLSKPVDPPDLLTAVTSLLRDSGPRSN